jgi:alpha-glucosidase (family GH31 glycosyl hydrolase)
MARAMYLRWPKHDDAYRHDRQYMLGDGLLVAPVGTPGDPATKTVWFPPGEWVDFFTGERHRGPAVKELSVPLGRMPVFARAGAVVPTQPYRFNEAAGPADRLILTAWAGADGAFRLYEDAGDGLQYRRGARAFTRVAHDDRGARGTVVSIGRARGSFPGRRARRAWELRLVGVDRPRSVRVGGRTSRSWGYSSHSRTFTVRIPALSTARTARVVVAP